MKNTLNYSSLRWIWIFWEFFFLAIILKYCCMLRLWKLWAEKWQKFTWKLNQTKITNFYFFNFLVKFCVSLVDTFIFLLLLFFPVLPLIRCLIGTWIAGILGKNNSFFFCCGQTLFFAVEFLIEFLLLRVDGVEMSGKFWVHCFKKILGRVFLGFSENKGLCLYVIRGELQPWS